MRSTKLISAISSEQVCLPAWSQPQNRGSPVFCDATLMMGGDHWQMSRAPSAYWRAAGADQWGPDGASFFPRVLVQLVGLEGRAKHRIGWYGIVQVSLEMPP